MQSKLIVVGVDRAPFSEFAWNEFSQEMSAREWSPMDESDSLFAAAVDAGDSDSSILRAVRSHVEQAADICGVSECETTCVVCDADE